MGLIVKSLGVSYLYLLTVVTCNPGGFLPEYLVNITGYDDFRILPKRYNSFLGADHVVNGVRQCGGPGTLLNWRHVKCNSTTTDLCQIPVNEFGRGEISFILLESAESLQVKYVSTEPTKFGMSKFTVTKQPQNDTFTKGNEYTCAYDSIHGHTVEWRSVRFSIIRPSDQVEELCAEAVFVIV